MTTKTFELTYSKCKNLINSGVDIRALYNRLNDQPEWLVCLGGIDCFYEIITVNEHGCDSGGYMPAVSTFEAVNCMYKHADDIADYIKGDDSINKTWDSDNDGFASFCSRFCSAAVERWCRQFEGDLRGFDY